MLRLVCSGLLCTFCFPHRLSLRRLVDIKKQLHHPAQETPSAGAEPIAPSTAGNDSDAVGSQDATSEPSHDTKSVTSDAPSNALTPSTPGDTVPHDALERYCPKGLTLRQVRGWKDSCSVTFEKKYIS